MKKLVYIIGSNMQYEKMFTDRGWGLAGIPHEADLIQFTGGSDVTPSYYGHGIHPSTGNDEYRDRVESETFNRLQGKIPMAGICRGGQFLYVMNGGKMYQDVDGHATGGTHGLFSLFPDDKGMFYISDVTSTHHQMMMWEPQMQNYIVAVADDLSTYREYVEDGEVKDAGPGKEVEVAHFPDTNCLAFQPHPEFYTGRMQDYYFKLIKEKLFKGRWL